MRTYFTREKTMAQASILTTEPEVFASEVVSNTDLSRFIASEEEIAKLFSVSEELVATLKTEFAPITWDTPKNYEAGKKAIQKLRDLRVGVSETHKELKADSLAYGRKVDAVKKHFTELLEAIEEPLIAAKQAVDTEKARLKAAKEAAEKAEIEAAIRAEREAEEARLKAIRDAEQAEIDRQKAELEAERVRMAAERAEAEAREKAERAAREAEERKARETREAIERAEKAKRDEAARIERERVEAEQKAERERLAAERRKLEDEQKAERDRAAAERQKVEDERRAVAAEKERLDRLEFERQAAITAEANARAKAEQDRVAAEDAAWLQKEQEAAALARIEALRPDTEKLHAFASAIRRLDPGEVTSPEAEKALQLAFEALEDIACALAAFGSESN